MALAGSTARSVLAGVLLACCPCAIALNPSLDVTQYAHNFWNIRDGFSKGMIWAIAQTPDGYLWLGTEAGILRFDGYKSVPWQPPSGQVLPSDRVEGLYTSRDGTLWIGTETGLVSWKNGKLTRYPDLDGVDVYRFLETQDGTLWAGAFGIPYGRLCEIRNGHTTCSGDDGRVGDGVYVLYEDANRNVWAGTNNGLWRWRPGPPKFYPLTEPEGIRALGADDYGALLIGMHGGIKRFMDGATADYPLSGSVPRFKAHFRLLRDRNGAFWIATADRGLVHVHQGKTDVYNEANGLSGDYVNAVFEDREGNIWAATRKGLDRFRDYAVATFSEKQGLSNTFVTSVLGSRDGSVWIGSAVGGLNRWKDGQISTFGINGRLNGQAPNSLFEDKNGRIWVSTQQESGYLDGDRLIPVDGVPGGRVSSIAEDNDGYLWIANQDAGLFQLRDAKLVRRFPWDSLGHRDAAMALSADPSKGGLWLGFYGGGVAYFKDQQVRESYEGGSRGMAQGRVIGLQFDREGALWAGGEGGLSRLKGGRVFTLNGKNGLPCNLVHAIVEDDGQDLWLVMACGLVRISHADLEAWAGAVTNGKDGNGIVHSTVFDNLDGVRAHVLPYFYSPQVARSSNGMLWFLASDGIECVDPRNLPFNKLPPPVDIQQVTADRNVYETGPPGRLLGLPALVRDLEIDYTALSLVAPEKMKFRYKLEGYDTGWREAGSRRQAFYGNLPPRQYRFRVMASNDSGVWSETGASTDFSIAPAYYQTNWFFASVATAFIALIWAGYRFRLRQIAREFNARVEGRVDERLHVARELHDTLLQSFQGLALRFQAARNLLPARPLESANVLDRALDLTQQALTEGREAIQNMRSSTEETNDLAEAIRAVGDELASEETAKFRMVVEGAPRNLLPLLRDEIYRIACEAIRNAFRHAEAKVIETEITYRWNLLLLRVRDDGRGMDPAITHSGRSGHFGLPGMRERAARIGGHLRIWSAKGAGTEIELSIPSSIAYATVSSGPRSWLFRRRGRTTTPAA